MEKKTVRLFSSFFKKNGEAVPLTRINPPNTINISSMNEPKTFATIMFLAAPPTNRKSDAAIWLSANKRRYCLKNLAFHKDGK